MRKICTFIALLAVLFVYSGVSNAQNLLTEDFSYTAGTALNGTGGWTAHSGTGTNAITVTTAGGASGLSYTGYAGNNIGLSVTLTTSGEDDNKLLSTPVTSGTMYAAAMINVASVTTAGYFFHLGNGTATFYARLYVQASGAGYNFGIAKYTEAATYESTVRTFGTTYLVVMKYTYGGVVNVFVNPTPLTSEPGTPTVSSTGIADPTTPFLTAVFLRQGSSAPTVTVDGIRAGLTWTDVIPNTSPYLIVTPNTLTDLGYPIGSPTSTSQSYQLTGANLSGGSGTITVSASTNFQVSTDNITFSSTSVTPAYSGGTINQTIYVRLKTGLALGSYGPETISNAGGSATTMNVTVSGSVDPLQQLVATPETLTGFIEYIGGGASASQTYSLTGSHLTPAAGNVTITAPANYEVSKDGSSFASTQTVAYTSATLAATTIYVRLISGLSVATYGPVNVANTGGGAPEEDVACTGSAVQEVLAISAYTSVNLSYLLGTGPSATTTYAIAGTNLYPAAGNITVTAPTNFQISADSITWGSSASVAYTSNALAKDVYVRLAGSLAVGTYGPGTLSFAGGGATTQNVTLNGSVTSGALLFSDNFSYSTGNLAGTDGWVAHSSPGTNPIQITTPGLTYSGLSGSGVGNAISMTSSGEDCNHQFTNIPLTGTGTVYASAMINVAASPSTAGDYFMHFSDGGTFDFYARTFIAQSGSGFVFGISKYNGVKTFTSTVYNFNQTYFIVIKYTSVPGATNDFCSLWVNPPIGGSETTPDLVTDALLLDASNISGIFLRQGSATTAPTVKVDGIKCGTTWASVTPTSGETLTLTALYEAMYVAGGSAMLMTPAATVELHDATSLATVESKTSTLSTAGVGTFVFTTAADGTPYYLVVKSPNTVETWSANAVSFTSGALSYDFTTGLSKAYTDGSNPSEALHGGKYCIYSGDVNQDGYVTADDYTGVDNDNTNFDYHVVNDVNGDGYVTADDYTFIDNNNTNFVQRQVPPGAPSHLLNRVKGHVQQNSVSK